jgi:hypothetical protein
MTRQTVVKKTLQLGKVDGYDNGRKSCALEVTIEIRQVDPREGQRDIDLNHVTTPFYELSITADVWNNRKTDIIMGGQMYDALTKFAPTKRVKRIVELWKRYHLNAMNAGTRLQSELLATYPPDERYDYTTACKRLADNDLYIDRGYAYGSAWLVEFLPVDVIIELAELFNADYQPLLPTPSTETTRQ